LPAALAFAQRARASAASFARPAAENFRFLAGCAGPLALLTAAQRARCAARIRAIPAALIFFRRGAAVTAGATADAPNNWFSSSCKASMRSFTSAARRSCFGVRFVSISIARELCWFWSDCQPKKVYTTIDSRLLSHLIGVSGIGISSFSSFSEWRRLPLSYDRPTRCWQLTLRDILGNRTHRYVMLVDGNPTHDQTCDGLVPPQDPQEERWQIETPRGPRVMLLFAQTK
jgi:hypothetical protein